MCVYIYIYIYIYMNDVTCTEGNLLHNHGHVSRSKGYHRIHEH